MEFENVESVRIIKIYLWIDLMHYQSRACFVDNESALFLTTPNLTWARYLVYTYGPLCILIEMAI